MEKALVNLEEEASFIPQLSDEDGLLCAGTREAGKEESEDTDGLLRACLKVTVISMPGLPYVHETLQLGWRGMSYFKKPDIVLCICYTERLRLELNQLSKGSATTPADD
ncbi:hypothetical protein MHYP_G00053850 [Metynnis hypsauchen]